MFFRKKPKLLRVGALVERGGSGGVRVRLEGIARVSKSPLTSPVHGRPCVKWHFEVERDADPDQEQESWSRHVEDESRIDFFLDDGSGIARVLAAKVEMPKRAGWQRGYLPERLVDVLAQRGESVAGRFRWREQVVRENESIAVIGVARVDESVTASAGYRQMTHGVLIDAPDDGWIVVE